MNEVVSHMTEMLGRILGEDIALQLNYCPRPALVQADAGMIEQVLLNLAVNSRDAMPNGGVLALKITITESDPRRLPQTRQAHSGPLVCVSAGDNGSGIAPENLGRLFEPFFTTKAVGKGTGLGLATVYGVVQQSGGHVTVESEPGQGAAFQVYLPALKEPAALRKSEPGRSSLPPGKETILLVEDEEGVRALTKHILKQCGYTVLEAKDGIEALRLAAHHDGRIHLLMTDVVMPHMGGREVAELMTAQWPQTKVLFLSGYTDDDTVRHGVREAEVSFLQKPFSPPALAQKVREVLEG
jgi:CheY-like chemotaxis protein